MKGVHETSEGPYITAPHKSGDIFTHAYNGGGGFGDVLERDPIKTASDVENGFLTAQVAHQVFGIVLSGGSWGQPCKPILRPPRNCGNQCGPNASRSPFRCRNG